MNVWGLIARRAGQVFGKALAGAMPRLANTMARKRKFGRPGYGTGRE